MDVSGRDSDGPHILVVQNDAAAPGGHFCLSLERHGATLSFCTPAIGQTLPTDPSGHDGLVVLGGPQHADDDIASPYFIPLMALMRAFEKAGKPVAGICLGCQLLARAHGGRVTRLGYLEFGFIRHRRTRPGEQDPVVGPGDLPRVMEFHEDSFELPDGGVLLIEGDSRCRNQCFRIGQVSYGFQFHIEIDSGTFSTWLDLFKAGGIETYRKYRAQIDTADLDALSCRSEMYLGESKAFCDRVADRWLALVKIRSG